MHFSRLKASLKCISEISSFSPSLQSHLVSFILLCNGEGGYLIDWYLNWILNFFFSTKSTKLFHNFQFFCNSLHSFNSFQIQLFQSSCLITFISGSKYLDIIHLFLLLTSFIFSQFLCLWMFFSDLTSDSNTKLGRNIWGTGYYFLSPGRIYLAFIKQLSCDGARTPSSIRIEIIQSRYQALNWQLNFLFTFNFYLVPTEIPRVISLDSCFWYPLKWRFSP